MSFIPIRKWVNRSSSWKKRKIIMWICVYPNWKARFDSKKWQELKFFLWNQSISSFIPMRRMNLWCPIRKRNMIIMWIRVIPINRWTLILKLIDREAFLMKPKHQCHLSQWVEWAYGTQSWKERRLLCESMFLLVDRSFYYET